MAHIPVLLRGYRRVQRCQREAFESKKQLLQIAPGGKGFEATLAGAAFGVAVTAAKAGTAARAGGAVG